MSSREMLHGKQFTYEVETGIPIPPKSRPGPKPGGPRYPFPAMSVGDSFAFAPADYQRVNTAAVHYASRHGGKFYGSYVECRIWRVA